MRYIRYAFLAALGVVLVTVSLANRNMVDIKLLPQPVAELIGFNLAATLPLFVVVIGGIVAGLIIGFVWEYLREHKHRAAASHHRRERERLEKEVDRLKEPERGSADEVLAIIDKREPAR